MGKSSFLKAILKQIPIDSGAFYWGKNVKIAYYEQELKELNPNHTALEEMWSRYPPVSYTHLKRETVNPKLTALNMELARVEDEIEKLLNTLTGANAVLLSYANSKIEELDTRRQTLTKEIAALSAETMSPEQIERLSVYLNQWKEIDFEDRRQVADGLISQIRATDEHVSIEWKI